MDVKILDGKIWYKNEYGDLCCCTDVRGHENGLYRLTTDISNFATPGFSYAFYSGCVKITPPDGATFSSCSAMFTHFTGIEVNWHLETWGVYYRMNYTKIGEIPHE